MASFTVPLRLNGTAKLHNPDINTFPFPLSTLSEDFLYSLPISTYKNQKRLYLTKNIYNKLIMYKLYQYLTNLSIKFNIYNIF